MSSKKLEKKLYRPQVGVDMLRQPPPLISSAARFHAASRVLLQSPSTQSPFLQLLFPGVGSLAILPTSILNSVPTLAGSRRAIQLLPHSQPSCLRGRLAATPPPGARSPPGFTSFRPPPKPRIPPQKQAVLRSGPPRRYCPPPAPNPGWVTVAPEGLPHPPRCTGLLLSWRASPVVAHPLLEFPTPAASVAPRAALLNSLPCLPRSR